VQGTQEVVTLVLKHSKQQKEQLVTFFVLDKNVASQDLIGAIRNSCKERLPGYMVPTHFIPLESLPLSANNKADSKQLAAKYNDLTIEELQSLGAASQSIKTWTSGELTVLSALATALSMDLDTIKSSANIFELGVDSISVIGLSRSLQRAGYENAMLSTIMKNSSISSLVKVLASANHEQQISHLVAAQKIAAFAHKNKAEAAEELNVESSRIDALAPCTPAQEGMIYRFLDADEALYFSTFEFALKEVDLEKLKGAWERVSKGLQVLRTKFCLIEDGCAQAVLSDVELPWNPSQVDDLQDATQKIRRDRKEQDKTVALADPYSINILQGRESSIMVLDIFHGLYDGMSLPLLLEQVQKAYSGETDIEHGPLFHSVLPYGPLAVVEGAEQFWRSTLADAEFQPFPKISLSATQHTISAAHTIPYNKIAHLNTLRHNLGTTYQSLLLAAWSSAIQAYITPNISFGLVISGRSIDFEGAEKIIGPLLNTVVFHTDIGVEESWKNLIGKCHEFGTKVLPFQHGALKEVQKWCGGELFDTLFVFQHEDEEVEGLWESIPGEAVADVSGKGSRDTHLLNFLQYPLAFEAQLNKNGDVLLLIIGQGSHIDQEVASKLLAQVEAALLGMQDENAIVPNYSSLTNGHANESHLNGYTRDEIITNGNTPFAWTPEALIIKFEIETLAKASDISATASIFALGLDSIDVIKLASRLKKRGVQLSVSSIIRNQSISKMVEQIAPKTEDLISQPNISLGGYTERLERYLKDADKWPHDAETVLPATPLQEGMVAEMIRSEYTRYFNHDLFIVAEDVDMEKLKDAWTELVNKHGILRTSFVEIDDVDLPMSFAQAIHKPLDKVWQTVGLPRSNELEQEMPKIIERVIEEAKHGRLLRLTHISHGDNRYYLLSIAHALYDGWSLQAMHSDIMALYHGKRVKRPDPSATLEQVLNQDTPAALKFWRTTLSGLPKSSFPLHTAKNSATVHRSERHSSHKLADIQSFCRTHSTPLGPLTQTVYALLLSSYLQRLDVVFGSVLSCRDTDEASEVLFPLMNTVAVRGVVHGSLEEMVRWMREGSERSREWQSFPLRRLQVETGTLFDTLFIFQGRARKSAEVALYQSVESISEVEFAVCVEVEIVEDELIWRTACRDNARTEKETQELLVALDTILGRILQTPNAQTIIAEGDGISVCGQPQFQNAGVHEPETNGNALKPTLALPVAEEEWSEMEKRIRQVLAKISRISEEEIRKDQTIFHLGLDSISAIKVSSLLRREGVRIGVQDIMRCGSVRGMALQLETDANINGVAKMEDANSVISRALKGLDVQTLLECADVPVDNVQIVMPVTAGQQYMVSRWLASGGTTFAATFEYGIERAVDMERLQRAWKVLVSRHEILRTVFVIAKLGDGHAAVQIVLKEAHGAVLEICKSSKEDWNLSLQEPVRSVVEEREDCTVLKLNILHALYDAISLPLLVDDLGRFYENPELDNLAHASSFQDFVAMGLAGSDTVVQKRRTFWSNYLGTPATSADDSSTVLDVTDRRIEVFRPSLEIGPVASIAQKEGVSVDAILLATWSKAYHDFLCKKAATEAPGNKSKDDVIFGLYLSNRTTEASVSLAAPTLNLLPLCVRGVSARPSDDVARDIQRDLRSLGDQDVVGTSLGEIYAWTGVGVECWVNILKAVEGDDHDVEKAAGEKEGGLFMKDATDSQESEMRRHRAEVVAVVPDAAMETVTKSVGSSVEAYPVCFPSQPTSSTLELTEHLPQASIDLELRLLSDGTLDIGIFAPEALVSLGAAEALIEDFTCLLRRLG